MAAQRRNPAARFSNRLLAALAPDDVKRVERDLDRVALSVRQCLHRPGDEGAHVYFPGGGFCSELTVFDNGDMVEVATIGREGMVGIHAARAGQRASSVAMVQAGTGTCHRLPADAFRRELERRGRFSDLVTRFAHAHLAFMMQTTACNAMHTVEQRLARWLLMADDRVGANGFPLTRESVAMMVWAAAPAASIAAGNLRKAGLIAYRRGRVVAVDRAALEAAACECYRVGTRLLLSVTDRIRSD